MTKQEYEVRYFDKKRIAGVVAGALRIPVSEALSAVSRTKNRTISVRNHYGKFLGVLSFKDVADLLADEKMPMSAAELERTLWSADGLVIDGFVFQDMGFSPDAKPTFYEPFQEFAANSVSA